MWCFMVRFDAFRSMMLALFLLAAACGPGTNADLTQGAGGASGAGGKPAGTSASSGAGGHATTAISSSSTGVGGTGGVPGTGGLPGTGGQGGAGGMPPMNAPCTVLVVDPSGNPVSGIDVVINDSSGAVTGTALTGINGKAVVEVPPNGIVSAFYAQGLSFSIVAAAAPPPGSVVRLSGPGPAPAIPQQSLATTYTVTPISFPATVTNFEAVTSCNGYVGFDLEQEPAAVPGGCSGRATETLWCIGYNANGTPLAWGSAVMPTNPGQKADPIFLPVNQPFPSAITDTITSIPSGMAAYISIDAFASDFYEQWTGGNMSATAPESGVMFSMPYLVLPGFATSFEADEQVTLGQGSVTSYLSRWQQYASLPPSITFDASTYPLVGADPLDVSDPVHPKGTWTVGGAPQGAAGYISMRWSGGTSATDYDLTFPSSWPFSFRMPDIPAPLSSYAPSAVVSFSSWGVEYEDDESMPSYADVLDGSAPGVNVIASGGNNIAKP
jgi:hypothetical protein